MRSSVLYLISNYNIPHPCPIHLLPISPLTPNMPTTQSNTNHHRHSRRHHNQLPTSRTGHTRQRPHQQFQRVQGARQTNHTVTSNHNLSPLPQRPNQRTKRTTRHRRGHTTRGPPRYQYQRTTSTNTNRQQISRPSTRRPLQLQPPGRPKAKRTRKSANSLRRHRRPTPLRRQNTTANISLHQQERPKPMPISTITNRRSRANQLRGLLSRRPTSRSRTRRRTRRILQAN